MISFSKEAPELTYNRTFALENVNDIANASLELLNTISKYPEFKTKFRLELNAIKNSDFYQLRIKLDSVSWFDSLVNQISEVNAVQVARKFVTESRNKLRDLPPVDPSHDLMVQPREYCALYPCTYINTRNGCNKPAHSIMSHCSQLMKRADGGSRQCNFFLYDEFTVRPGGHISTDVSKILAFSKNFNLGNRREPIRDLLLVPKYHKTNDQLVTDSDMWNTIALIIRLFEAVIRTSIQNLPTTANTVLEGVAVNFGRWETAQSMDDSQYALDCHGHIHLLLTRLAVDVLVKDDGFSGLRGRVQHPDTNLELDCREMENLRLLGAENKIMQNDISIIKSQLSQIIDMLSQK